MSRNFRQAQLLDAFRFGSTENIEQLQAAFTNILSGAGAPATSLGQDGNIYLDTTGNELYAREAGAWVRTGNNERVGRGTSFPASPTMGDLFILSARQGTDEPGIYFYNGTDWIEVANIDTSTTLPFTVDVSESSETGPDLTLVRDSTVSVLISIGSAELNFALQEESNARSLSVGQRVQLRNTVPNPDIELDFNVASVFETQNTAGNNVQVYYCNPVDSDEEAEVRALSPSVDDVTLVNNQLDYELGTNWNIRRAIAERTVTFGPSTDRFVIPGLDDFSVENNGMSLGDATTINFTGNGVTAVSDSTTPTTKEVRIPGGGTANLPFTVEVSDSSSAGTENTPITPVRNSEAQVLVDIGSAVLTFAITENTASLANGTRIRVVNTTPTPDIELDFIVQNSFVVTGTPTIVSYRCTPADSGEEAEVRALRVTTDDVTLVNNQLDYSLGSNWMLSQSNVMAGHTITFGPSTDTFIIPGIDALRVENNGALVSADSDILNFGDNISAYCRSFKF